MHEPVLQGAAAAHDAWDSGTRLSVLYRISLHVSLFIRHHLYVQRLTTDCEAMVPIRLISQFLHGLSLAPGRQTHATASTAGSTEPSSAGVVVEASK